MKLLPILLNVALADLYLQIPRGSNNRLNERSKQRSNQNRLFDSQNNNNGGYNVADKHADPAVDREGQHKDMYFQSGKTGNSYMTVEWYHQHGCGKRDAEDTNHIDCHFILQYKCQDELGSSNDDAVSNGFTTAAPDYSRPPNRGQETYAKLVERRKKNLDKNNESGKERGQHESWENHDSCRTRYRNINLFNADQSVGTQAVYTRQNQNGARRGYECPEERDYYPYWHPTEWTDVAVLTSSPDNCDHYRNESSNGTPKGECVQYYEPTKKMHASKANTPEICAGAGGDWLEFYDYLMIHQNATDKESCNLEAEKIVDSTIVWGYPRQIGSDRFNVPKKQCLMLHPEVDCQAAPWTRANHLGNTGDGNIAQYRWKLPYFPDNKPKQCIFRMRYNISSDDYFENMDDANIVPFYKTPDLTNDPKIVLTSGVKLQLAIDTAQISRTFQDRSHTFKLAPRSAHGIDDGITLDNLQVRGKRGNIVQTFPAVEYDFSPQRLTLSSDTAVHIHWAGSNTNPKGNDGEGKDGSDRNNMVSVEQINWNIPVGKVLVTETHEELKIGGKKYHISRSRFRYFHQAANHCAAIGMRLPLPENQEENDAFKEISGGNFFMAASDDGSEGTFKNIYTGVALNYTNWRKREPNNYTVKGSFYFNNGEHYLVFMRDGEWNDAGLNSKFGRFGSAQTVCIKPVVENETPQDYASMFDDVEWIWTSSEDVSVRENITNLELQMASSGYYDCVDGCEKSIENRDELQAQLDNAPASYDGNVIRFRDVNKVHHYISTRNNNFSNRAQKGDISVKN